MQQQEEPSDIYNKLIKVIRLCSRLIGADALDENFKFNAITAFVVISIIWYYLCSVYTISKDFSEDWTVLLDVISPVSCTTQGLVKLISVLLYSNLYSEIEQEIAEIYKKYQTMGEKYKMKLLEWCKSMKTILITVAITYFLTAVIVLIAPLALYIWKGEKHLIILCQMPYLDVKTNEGYIATTIFNLICVFIAAFGLYAGDLFLLLFLTHSIFFFDIFTLKVEHLHEIMQRNRNDARITTVVNDIVEWHKFYLEHNDKCNTIFFWTISAHVICTTLGILSTLLIIMLKDWPGAYAYILTCFVWLYMYSIVGTRVEISNDEFTKGIYEINWYDLDVSNQQTIKLMLLQSQVPRNITIAGVEPLSVNTALRITQTIYSMVMMVQQLSG